MYKKIIIIAVKLWVLAWGGVRLASAEEGLENLFSDGPVDSLWFQVSPDLFVPIENMEVGDYTAAAEELREIVSQDPSNLPALRLLASTYGRMDNPVKAIQVCEQIALLDSTDATVEVALAHFHQKQGDFSTAEKHYRQALFRDSDMIQAYQGLGWIFLALGHFEKCLDMVTETTERVPGYASNYLLMGRVLTAQGFYKDASMAYRRAFALSPVLRESYGILLQELTLRHRLMR